jgi:hypothetical protein
MPMHRLSGGRALARQRNEVVHRRPAVGPGEGVKLFRFSSFDEPWKLGQEREVGTQWGLWDKDERAKHGGQVAKTRRQTQAS